MFGLIIEIAFIVFMGCNWGPLAALCAFAWGVIMYASGATRR